ncbi:MAG: hypothetical protein ACOCYP_04185 [Planctomycetota bacterium]
MWLLWTLCWLALPALPPLGVWWSVRHRRLPVAMKNAIASGFAAAGVVIAAFLVIGATHIGPLADQPAPGWAWRIPAFTTAVAVFACAAGWSATTLYLGARQYARGLWGRIGCPTAWQVVGAWLVLLSLAVIYGETGRLLAQLLVHPTLDAASIR